MSDLIELMWGEFKMVCGNYVQMRKRLEIVHTERTRTAKSIQHKLIELERLPVQAIAGRKNQ